MKTFEPMDHKATGLDIRLRTVLSSWKKGRGFHSVASSHYRKRLVLHSSKTELNREYGKRGAVQLGLVFLRFVLSRRHRLFLLALLARLKMCRTGPSAASSAGLKAKIK